MNFIKTEYFNHAELPFKHSFLSQLLYAALKSADFAAILLNHSHNIQAMLTKSGIQPTAKNTDTKLIKDDNHLLLTNFVKKDANYSDWIAKLLESHDWMTQDLFEDVLEKILKLAYISYAIDRNENGWDSTLIPSSVRHIIGERKYIGEVIHNLDEESLEGEELLSTMLCLNDFYASTLADALSLRLAMQLTDVMQKIFYDFESIKFNERSRTLFLHLNKKELTIIHVPNALFHPLPFSRSVNPNGIYHIFKIRDDLTGITQDDLKAAFHQTLSNPINKVEYHLNFLSHGYVIAHHTNQNSD